MEGPLAALTEEFKHELKVYKVERDSLYELVDEYNLEFIPAFLIFSNGQLIKHLEGETTLAKLQEIVKAALASKDPQKK